MHFQHILQLVKMHCGRFRVLKYQCATVISALSLPIQLHGKTFTELLEFISLSHTHFNFPFLLFKESLTVIPLFFFLSALLFFHFLHEHFNKDESTGPQSEPARHSFGALGNVLWKWGTAVCFVVNLLISRRLYVALFSKSIRQYYESKWTEMRCSK